LKQLEAISQVPPKVTPVTKTAPITADATQQVPARSSEDEGRVTKDGEAVIKDAPASRSAEAVYREQNVLFNNTFSLETGVSYTHSDRRQLTLNGFLALDAIFLGDIKLDRVKSDITQLDVTGRYGVTDRLQFDFNAPFLYRSSTYESGGVGGSASTLGEQTVNKTDIGDVSAGAYYRLFAETPTRPDIVLNVRVKAPTGKNPYGIKYVELNSVSTPNSIPTGNGLWALSTGLTFVKTVDPAILFANIGYTHNFTRKFDDISGDPNSRVSGEIDLGDAYQVAGGLAFALNEKMSLSMSYAHRFSEKARINQGTAWQNIIGSDASAGSLNFGVTYAMSDKLSMVASVAMGVTPDAPDVTVGVKFPYNF